MRNPYMPHITNRTYLEPECGALPNRRQLRGLEVGETEGGQVAILVREVSEAVDDDRKLLQKKRQGFADEDQVGVTKPRMLWFTVSLDSTKLGVLGHITRRCTQTKGGREDKCNEIKHEEGTDWMMPAAAGAT